MTGTTRRSPEEAARPEECECCNYPAEKLEPYTVGGPGYNFPEETRWFCNLCAGSLTSNCHNHRSNYLGTDTVLILSTICNVGNALLAAIEADKAAAEGQAMDWMRRFKDVEAQRDSLAAQLAEANEVLRSIRDNFDHDEDAHKYDTECRKCAADAALKGSSK